MALQVFGRGNVLTNAYLVANGFRSIRVELAIEKRGVLAARRAGSGVEKYPRLNATLRISSGAALTINPWTVTD